MKYVLTILLLLLIIIIIIVITKELIRLMLSQLYVIL